MTVETKITELANEILELNRQRENLAFLKEYNFTRLLDLADEAESKHQNLHVAIQTIIDHQLKNDPKQMDEREREIWFASTSARLERINKLIDGVIEEIDKMKEV